MGFVHAHGRSGIYDYFFCWSRHKHLGCDLPYVPADIIEAQVESSYDSLQLSGEMLLRFRDSILNAMKHHLDGAEKAAERARKRIIKLEAERRNLLQAYMAEAVPIDLTWPDSPRTLDDGLPRILPLVCRLSLTLPRSFVDDSQHIPCRATTFHTTPLSELFEPAI